ncbi:hypothetical protein PV396_24590 [Streptomyces sp. ME02-8801-2C]|uniref:hypothetical protein n=1 Tax=Streptomyces sp. ME02-8801-2C TaxID=3028680 RepID=UPI0029B0C4E8|nr:hypothetical protein [Streptomyces sp. ME02-8801-2C]MDX3455081.1 hypothetical protein [Streptomyces sp. ME02-8801-2C]
MSTAAECARCHQPIRSAAATARRIGSHCWRKLSPAERATIRRLLKLTPAPSTARVRAALNHLTPPGEGQLPLDTQEINTP